MFGWFKKKPDPAPVVETRAAASGFTAEIMTARESYISGTRGIGELTATAQTCVSHWENGLLVADVTGTDLLDRRALAMIARGLALRGEAVFLIRDEGLVPCADWDLRTRNGRATAYRVSVSEAGGGRTETALAAEVLHFRLGVDPIAPWAGQAPLKRCQLTAGTLQAIESALSEIFTDAPLGSQVVPFPENPDVDSEAMARGFRGRRGRVLLRESVTVAAAGGPAPAQDWRPSDLTPDLEKAQLAQALEDARGAICLAFGILPAMLSPAATGPLIREGQRHLAQWMLQPIAEGIAEEASEKLGQPVTLDVMRPLQAFDAGGRARAAATVIQALALAKEAGVDPATALNLVDWEHKA
ncbi:MULTISPECIES: phage portal protein [unclassified Mameliella]|uniref:phage portal protein n=1 Tax=unclassified Mameliella TaxID=2630630 RepID=UPI002740141A|nr:MULTISPECIES: phage portal protein [unclassified Mameliella]